MNNYVAYYIWSVAHNGHARRQGSNHPFLFIFIDYINIVTQHIYYLICETLFPAFKLLEIPVVNFRLIQIVTGSAH